MDYDLARRVVELAGRAPSVYNTQPWRFVVTPTGLDLYADRGRQLTVLDATGRQLTVSCGAALGLAELAARALGYSCTVELLPDDRDLDHLARLTIGAPAPPHEDDLALVREIGRRRMVRDRFDAIPLPEVIRRVLERDAEAHSASLQWLGDATQRLALAVLTERAGRIEQADPAIRAELAGWLREQDTAADGMTAGVLPELSPAERASDVPLREFLPRPTDPADVDPQHLPLPVERPDLVVLCTRYDGPTSWLQAGQALARMLLRATELGVAASPLGQALDLAWTRRQLRAELRLTGYPQLVLRLGHGRPTGVPSGRRPVSEIMESRA